MLFSRTTQGSNDFKTFPIIRGLSIFQSSHDFLRECGYKSSYLWTTHELHAAIALYKKFGFTLTEEKESTTFGKLLTEQRYDLVLP